MNQQESFQAAKLAYRQFKLRVRKTLSPTHVGPEILEDAVVDYIVRNLDLYDVQTSVSVCLLNIFFHIIYNDSIVNTVHHLFFIHL